MSKKIDGAEGATGASTVADAILNTIPSKLGTIDRIRAAQKAAMEIIQGFVKGAADTPDAVAARKEELGKLDSEALIARILELEAPKSVAGVKVEDIAKTLLVNKDCAILTYDQIAGMITGAFPDRNTSAKSIASYVSKHKGELGWEVAPREKLKIDMNSLMAVVNG